jgi:Protein of unknown function (DUF732)/Domain of unknown function (DUF4189)
MTSDEHNTEDQPTSTGSAGHGDSDSAPSDAEDYPETAPGTSHGAGDAETKLVPPATAAAPEHAWSNEEPVTEALSRPWRSVWVIAGIGLLCAVIVAFAIFGVVALVRENHGGTHTAPTTPTHSASAPAPVAPAAPQAARPDDDEFVALAISPRAIDSARHGGFGTSGTQDQANRIALSECRASTGNDDCLTVNAGMFHGCVSYAIDSSRSSWASGSGPDPAAARADALRRLEGPAFGSYVQCSDPPGIIRAPESAAAPPPSAAAHAAPLPPPAPSAVTVEPPAASAPDADQVFRNFVLQIPDVHVVNWGIAETSAHNICNYLAGGHTHDDTTQQVLQNDPTFTPWQASAMVNASTTAYCPQYGR